MHVHLAEAARWKDGPSAGVAVAVALVSALTGQPVRGDVATSGELTLAGTVEPVGGVRQKVLGACRARMAAVILPSANEADIAENFGDELPCGITARYVTTMDDVLKMVLPDVVAQPAAWPPVHARRGRRSRRLSAPRNPFALSGATGRAQRGKPPLGQRRPHGQAAVGSDDKTRGQSEPVGWRHRADPEQHQGNP